MTTRSIVLRNETIRSLAIAAVSQLPVSDNNPLEIVIRPYKAKRKVEANGLYWLRLGEIADQAYAEGKQYSAYTWHEYMKRRFLPDVDTKGNQKWAHLPSGDRALIMSTTTLNTSEFAEYITQVEAFGASLGVMFSASPV